MEKKLKKNSFMQGTIIASASIIFVKVLGALYVIPFYKIIGEQGGALYSYSYTIYNLFLNISTAGIPIALSMIVSEFCTNNMYDAKERAYKIGKIIVSLLSIISFLIIFIFSDKIAYFLTSGNTGLNTLDDISFVIKAISICLLITPLLGVLRGYLQGHKFIGPSSTSQILEQIIRILVVLLGSYLAIRVYQSKISTGVGIALTGAFIGALFAYLFLKIKIKQNKESFPKSKEKDNISNKQILKKLVTYCIPLILTSIVSNLYETIDLKLIIKGLNMINYDPKEVEVIASVISTWTPKICVIITAISMGLITSLIPHIISSYVKKDMKDVNNKFNLAISTMLFATIPMSLFIIFLSKEVYYLFYGYSLYGPLVLKFISIVNLFLGLVTIINTVLQGVKKFKLIYLSTFVGLLVNTILDIPLILLFNELGLCPYTATMISSIIGYSLAFIIVVIILNKKLGFIYKDIFKNIKRMILPTISIILVLLLDNFINLEYNVINVLIKLIVFGVLSLFVYLVVSYKTGLINSICGNNILRKIKR